MSTTCVKGSSAKENKETRRKGENYVEAAQQLGQVVTPDGYGETIADKAEIERTLEKQKEDLRKMKKDRESTSEIPDVPALKLLEQLGDKYKITKSTLDALAGDIGEKVAVEVAISKLGLNRTDYVPKKLGVDAFCRSSDGSYIMLEGKNRTVADGRQALHRNTKFGDQGSVTWLGRKLSLMERPQIDQRYQANQRIAREIRSQGGANSVDRILVHLNPHTMRIFAYRGVDNAAKVWEPIAVWEFNPNLVASISKSIL